MTKHIPLTQGKFAIVDDSDYEYLTQWKWQADKSSQTYYAKRTEVRGEKSIKMHRVIMNASDGMTVDHINGNGLDNRKENMRLCSQRENSYNRGMNTNNKSGYKGVYWSKKQKCWCVSTRINYKTTMLSGFKDAKDAARAYNNLVLEHRGAFARLNQID